MKRRGKRRPWTAAEDRILRRDYPHKPTKQLVALFKRPLTQIYQHAARLGLAKTPEYMASSEACRLRRGDNVGAAYRFPKGHVPANKGLRRPGWSPGRMAETQFKKGERTGMAAKNWRPIGTILPDSEGFLRIKVREAVYGKEPFGFGNTKVWPLLNRYVWEQHHGPIPPGHVIAFKDRNRANCDIGNLEMITCADNMRRNSIHTRLSPELKEVVYLRIAIKSRITKTERKLNGSKKQDHELARPPVRDAGSVEGRREAHGA